MRRGGKERRQEEKKNKVVDSCEPMDVLEARPRLTEDKRAKRRINGRKKTDEKGTGKDGDA